MHAPTLQPALADRLADRINPVALKELRQAVKSRFVNGMLLTLLGVMAAIAIGYAAMLDPAREAVRGDGAWLFTFLTLVLGLVAGFGLPLYVGVRLAVERSSATGDLLRMTTLMPWAIVRGKMLAGVVLAGLIASACVPFIVSAWLLRGVGVVTILGTLASVGGLVALALSLALMVGASPYNAVLKAVYAVFMIPGTLVLLLVLSGLLSGVAVMTGGGAASTLLTSFLAYGVLLLLFLSRAAGWLSPKGASRSRTTRGPSKAWVGRKKAQPS